MSRFRNAIEGNHVGSSAAASCGLPLVGIAMSDWTTAVHNPESCLCPRCERVMRLVPVPALRALDTSEFFFRCDECEYVSLPLNEISSPELVCDIDRRSSKQSVSELVDEAIARLIREAGAHHRRRDPPKR